MQHYRVVKIERQMFTICLLRTTALFIKDCPVFFVGNWSNWTTKWDLWHNWTTLCRKELTTAKAMSGVKSVSRHKKAPQGGLIARQNLAICVSRTTCLAISTNLSSGWFYNYHRGSLINKDLVLLTQICGPTKTTVWIMRLSILPYYVLSQVLLLTNQ